jgi:hypothetical protein
MIDVHVHLGVSQSTGKLTTEKNILDAISTYKLDMVMVMPQPTDPDRDAVHERIYDLTQRCPGRIAGIANLDPRVETAVYEKQFVHCIEEFKFVAVKVHTHGFTLPADAPAWDKVYALAAERQLPVMVHTGIGREIADPANAVRFPPECSLGGRLKSGFGLSHDYAVILLTTMILVFIGARLYPRLAS